MLTAKIIFAPLIFLSLAKLTKQAKKKDCVKGKTYWSEESFIPGEDGVCIACPPNWQTCNHQPIGNGNRQRCVDSCRVKPKSSSSSKLPLTSTTSFIPPERFPSTPTSVAYTLQVRPPVGKKQVENDNEELENNTGLITAVSALAVFIVIVGIVAVVLVIRKIRSRPARARSRGDSINEEEGIYRHIEEARHEEQRHDDRDLQADIENRSVAVQETQTPGPVQSTPSERNTCGIQDTGQGNFPSCFHLDQVKT